MNNYPTYTREQNRSIKLSLEQIERIKQLKSIGYSISKISKMFGVSNSGIKYQLMTEEEKKEANARRRKYKKTYNPEVARRFLDNKKSTHRKEILNYRKKVNESLKARNPEAVRERDRIWHKENRKSRAKPKN